MLDEDRVQLLSVNETGGVSDPIPGSIPDGTDVAKAMFREICDWLWNPGLSVLATQEFARHILNRITDYASYCEPPIQTNYLFDTGCAKSAAPIRLPDYADGYLYCIQHCVGLAVRSCVDATVSADRFEQSLQLLMDKLRTTRRNALGP
jgi:hypothetical protein